MKNKPDLAFEEKYWSKNYYAAGIDEVGRGALAGPLVVSVVIFKMDMNDSEKIELNKLGINDSKKLTPKKRKSLSKIIKENCFYYNTVFIHSDSINNNGINGAFAIAVNKLIHFCKDYCCKYPISFLIDGNPISHIPYNHNINHEFIVKGDGLSISIAAASILAKVERDEYMTNIAQTCRGYGWDKNKGYGTQIHIDAIRQIGISSHHRIQFIKNIST